LVPGRLGLHDKFGVISKILLSPLNFWKVSAVEISNTFLDEPPLTATTHRKPSDLRRKLDAVRNDRRKNSDGLRSRLEI
jgi:hypothetical protein